MKRKEILRRLEERLARGEISEKTYLQIKARYDAEPEEPEEDFDSSLEGTVSRIVEDAARVAKETVRVTGEAMEAMDFSGLGVKLSEEAIKIAGSGVVSGRPVRTREFKAAGSARVRGSLEAREAKVAGSCVFEGDVHVSQFRTSGSSKVQGTIRAENLESSGSLHVDKDMDVRELRTSGSLRVGGRVQAGEFRSAGSVHIGDVLKAHEADLELGGSSSIRGIQADEIRVRGTGGFFRARGDLTAERIEGREVSLEGTSAAFVKGDEVRLGPHCRIDVVEARELVVHESSEVKERRVPGS